MKVHAPTKIDRKAPFAPGHTECHNSNVVKLSPPIEQAKLDLREGRGEGGQET